MTIVEQGCDCTLAQHQRGDACSKGTTRCRGRFEWMRDNDPTFRRTWAGWFGIPTLHQQSAAAGETEGHDA